MTEWTERRIQRDDVGVTAHTLDSGVPGPRLLVIAGVHGNEIGAIIAAAMLTQRRIELTSGALTVVPVAHEAAHLVFERRGPADDLDLARTFPGAEDGSPTVRLAHLLTEEVIRGASAMLDLHTSSPDADLPLFAGAFADGTEIGAANARMARAFGLPVVWTHPTLGPGRTLGVAAEQGIPAMYVESPSGGVLRTEATDLYVRGVMRICAMLGMIAPSSADELPDLALWLHGSGNTDTFAGAPRKGYFAADTELLASVTHGDLVGRVFDSRGRIIAPVYAPATGSVAFLRREAAVDAGTPLVSVAQSRPVRLFPY